MTNNNYLELHLPEYLQTALNQFIEGKEKYDKGGYFRFDCDMDFLNASINCAEVDNEISSEQAWHLRENIWKCQKKTIRKIMRIYSNNNISTIFS